MADNEYKREICNMAISILREGKTSAAGQFHTSIDDTEFADYTTASTQGLQRICFNYPAVLKEVLRDIQPDFAKQFADLGAEIRINKEIADWEYLFEFPSDYVAFVAQIAQSDRKTKYDAEELLFDSYAHVVTGSDDQSYYCSLDHTGAAATTPITGANYATNWTIYDEDDLGADHVTGWSYKASHSGFLLGTNSYSNEPSTTVDSSLNSAYIQYIPYVQAGINDKPQYYTDEFKRAFAVRLAVALTKDPEKQLNLLKRFGLYEKPQVLRVQNMGRYVKPHVTTFEARTR